MPCPALLVAADFSSRFTLAASSYNESSRRAEFNKLVLSCLISIFNKINFISREKNNGSFGRI